MKILFKNAKILDVYNSQIFYGAVEVVDDTIKRVGDFSFLDNYDRVIDCKLNLLMPGFVNTHCHSPMTILRGFKDDVNLQDWLFNNILPAEKKLSAKDIYWGEYLAILEYVRAGITTIEEGYFENQAIYRALFKSGMRARLGFGPTTRDTGLTNIEYLENEYNTLPQTDLIKTSCFIHSIYTTTEEVVKETSEWSDNFKVPVSIHLAETTKEVLDCMANNKETPTEYLNKLGFFKNKALCYHCVHMSDNDLDILKENEASISTCSSSNMKLASGIAPIKKMLDKGLNITIGTDGTASNNSLDMFKEMFLVATLSKVNNFDPEAVPASEVLKMATINGAKALGFNTGEICPNKKADIILIDLNQAHYHPQDNLISHLVYAGKSSDVYLTMIGGKIVYEKGKYNVGERPASIYEKVNAIRKRLQQT